MEYKYKNYQDYHNEVEIELKCKNRLSPEDMSAVQAAIDIIATKVIANYGEASKEKEL